MRNQPHSRPIFDSDVVISSNLRTGDHAMEKAMQDSDLPVELCCPFSEPDLAGALGEDRVHYPSLFG